jgi:hypothetical protein
MQMKGHGEKLSRKKERAVKALLENDTHAEAARATGIGEATLWRWMQEPDFKEAFRNAKRRVLNQAITNLQKATSKAIKAVEVEDLEARVERIEQALKER